MPITHVYNFNVNFKKFCNKYKTVVQSFATHGGAPIRALKYNFIYNVECLIEKFGQSKQKSGQILLQVIPFKSYVLAQ